MDEDLFGQCVIFDFYDVFRHKEDNIVCPCCSNLFRVFGATPGSEEASTLEASKTPNRCVFFQCITSSVEADCACWLIGIL